MELIHNVIVVSKLNIFKRKIKIFKTFNGKETLKLRKQKFDTLGWDQLRVEFVYTFNE